MMNFCSNCGQRVTLGIPPGDDRERHICPACDTIHYFNPRIVTGCLPVFDDQGEDKILLCRRAIEPRYGRWTLPAGFMENGETTEQGAARECWEEARAKVKVGQLYTMTSIPGINQVHMFFHARLPEPSFDPGPESLEVKLFREQEIPWDQLSFTSVRITLEHFFADCKRGRFSLHSGTAAPDKDGHWGWRKNG